MRDNNKIILFVIGFFVGMFISHKRGMYFGQVILFSFIAGLVASMLSPMLSTKESLS